MNVRRTAWLGLMLLACALAGTALGAGGPETVTVVFQHDNYSSLSPTDFDAELLNLFGEHEIPATFAVIPFVSSVYAGDPGPHHLVPLTIEKAATLRKVMGETRLEVALHGYSHQTIHADKYFEFVGMPYEEQRERIRKGREHLETLLGAKITTFVPPADSYDENTLRAIEAEGFTAISSSLQWVAGRSTRLSFVPGTTSIDRVREAVTAARESGEKDPVVVVLFHSIEFVEIDPERGRITLDEFKDLLGWVKTQENLRLRNLSEVASSRPDLHAALFNEKSSGIRLGNRLTPEALGNLFPYYFLYPSPRAAAMIRVKGWAVLALIYLGALVTSAGVAFLVSRVLAKKLALLWKLARYGGIVALCGLAFYVFRDSDVFFRGAIALVIGFGLLAGIWLALFAEHGVRSRT